MTVTRRLLLTRSVPAGLSLTVLGFGISKAAALPASGPAARFIQRTFAENCDAIDAAPLVRHHEKIAYSYERVWRDLETSGFNAQETQAYSHGSNRMITIDAGDSLGVASENDEECVCSVLPEETGALLSSLDEEMGLPAVYKHYRRTWTSEAALRYATPTAAMWRRDRCSRVSSRFKAFGQGVDRCEIEITPHMDPNGQPTGRAKVRIESPAREALEHPALPTRPSAIPATPHEKQALAGDWKLIG